MTRQTSMATDLNLLPAIEIETGSSPTHSVIWMHGLGADGNDFVPIVRELDLPPAARIRFIFPHAPMRPVTINGGFVMRAWYDISHQDFSRREDEKGVRESQKAIEALMQREQQRGTAAQNILLAGFSQGGAMALQTGLRYPQRLAGVMVLSAYLPLPDTLAAEAEAANLDAPIFMAHGDADSIVPMPLAAASRERLARHGYQVEWREYPMPHSVCLEEIADISSWLKQVLKAGTREM